MSEPEIARRCHSCGASIRARSFFCPQCGEPLAAKADVAEIPKDLDADMPPATTTHSGENRSERVTSKNLKPENWEAFPSRATAPKSAGIKNPPMQAGRGAAYRKGRAASALIEDDLHGVEKWRQISSAVLDEASYDPSLRFVLVAAVLFILFVVLLLLSELLR